MSIIDAITSPVYAIILNTSLVVKENVYNSLGSILV